MKKLKLVKVNQLLRPLIKKRRLPYFYSALDLVALTNHKKLEYEFEIDGLPLNHKQFSSHMKIKDKKINKWSGRVNGVLPKVIKFF